MPGDQRADARAATATTFVNSGNAVFRTDSGSEDDHERRIAAALESDVGVRAGVIVKSARVLAAIVDENPLRIDPTEASRCLVAFPRDQRTLVALARTEVLVVPPERYAIGAHAVYVSCPGGVRECEAATWVLGPAGGDVTTRNWATTCTLRALADRVDGGAA